MLICTNTEPKDRFHIVYIILIIHGIAILMPWNMFINATEYFTDHKLTLQLKNGTQIESKYKEYFLSNVGIAAQIPNVLFNVLNIFFHLGETHSTEGYTHRVLGSIIIELIFMILTVILAIIDTSEWITLFFYLTMLTVIILNIVNGIYQNSVYGFSSRLPMKYTNAIVTGSNVCGTFTALMNIITIWLSPNKRIAAIYFFASSILILFFAFVTFFMLKKNHYYRYHWNQSLYNKSLTNGDTGKISTSIDTDPIKSEDLIFTSSSSLNDGKGQSKRPPYLYVFKFVWKQCLNVFLVFFITLSTFPVIQSGIKPIDPEFFGSIEKTQTYYIAVCCFLIFNACAMFGSIAPNFIIFPGPEKLWIPVISRFLFIPFFMLCNYVPDRRQWPVWIQSDFLYVFGGILMGFSSGYYSSLSMMYAPKSVPNQKYAGVAAMMAAASLVSGIFFGINFSYFLAWLIRQ
ncbi:equilibrative nucleoside transporter 1-like protein [Sarcoptes scabiei]|nr:equilibrative nucleoside transporter 1-like protein [Sarcoptes scabiei]